MVRGKAAPHRPAWVQGLEVNSRIPTNSDALLRAASLARAANASPVALQALVGAKNASQFRAAANSLPAGFRAEHVANERFFKNFHNAVVSSGRALEGVGQDPATGARFPEITTMRIGDYELDGKTYLIPYYDPALRRVLNRNDPADDARLRAQLIREIESGRITGYDSPQEAEAHRKQFYGDFEPHMRGGGLIP